MCIRSFWHFGAHFFREANPHPILPTKWRQLCSLVPHKHGVDPMLDKCWATIYDVSPTLDHHRVNVCLLTHCVVWTLACKCEIGPKIFYPCNAGTDLTFRALSQEIWNSRHLNLCLATAIHNFKWPKISLICKI